LEDDAVANIQAPAVSLLGAALDADQAAVITVHGERSKQPLMGAAGFEPATSRV
jgi:hypothetical protein